MYPRIRRIVLAEFNSTFRVGRSLIDMVGYFYLFTVVPWSTGALEYWSNGVLDLTCPALRIGVNLRYNYFYSIVENHVLWAWSEIFGYASLLFSGVLECWNIGFKRKYKKAIFSVIPIFHHSITPILQEIHERAHGVKTPFQGVSQCHVLWAWLFTFRAEHLLTKTR